MPDSRFPLLDCRDRFGQAVAWTDGTTELTYAELLEQTRRRAANLAAIGIRCGDRVCFVAENDLDALLNIWAILWSGAVACPLSPRFSAAQVDHIVNELGGVRLMLAPNSDAPPPECSYRADAPATVILSSGSTGSPKAIVHSLQAHLANAQGAATNIPIASGDRWIWSLPVYHVSGLSIVIRCAAAGATIVQHSDGLSATELDRLQITHLSLVSTQLRRLMDQPHFPSSHLQAVLLGGSAVPSSLVKAARDIGVPVHTTYGMTEMASQITTSSCQDAPSTSGRVLPRRELRIRDGEILVRGETLCLGYWKDGEVVAATDEAGWFHTGDLGELDSQGRLFVTGRIDNMFISGGENIYPEAIEKAMLELDGVEQAIVVPRSDPEFGERPVAFLDRSVPLAPGWREDLKHRLRSFEVPVDILPWPADASSGIKPSRSELRKIANSTGSDPQT